jgi:uncharacterized protein
MRNHCKSRAQCLTSFKLLPLMQLSMPKAASTTPLYIVRRSSIHSRGVFARQDIKKDDQIIEYIGVKISKSESERRANERLARAETTGEAAVYIFNLNKRQDLDGSGKENLARLINHSCDPNCEAIQSRGRIWICAMRDIKKGDELTFNYGFDLENWDRHECRCGTERCVGFIVGEEYWPGLKMKIEQRIAKFEKIRAAAKKVLATKGKKAAKAK